MEPKNRIWNAASALQKRQTPLDRGIMKRTVGKPLSELCDDAGLSALHIARSRDETCSHCGYMICNCANVLADTSGYARQPVPAWGSAAWARSALLLGQTVVCTKCPCDRGGDRGKIITRSLALGSAMGAALASSGWDDHEFALFDPESKLTSPEDRLYTWQEAHELIEHGYTMTQDVTLKNTNFVLWRKRDGKQEHLTAWDNAWERHGRDLPAGMRQLIERRESNGFVITNRESF